MVFEHLDDDSPTFAEASGEKLRQLSVGAMQFASGMTQTEDDEMLDIFIIEFEAMNGDKHELVFQWAPAMELAIMLKEWLAVLHEQGRCGCGEHDDKTTT